MKIAKNTTMKFKATIKKPGAHFWLNHEGSITLVEDVPSKAIIIKELTENLLEEVNTNLTGDYYTAKNVKIVLS